jgi:hypothetical protein
MTNLIYGDYSEAKARDVAASSVRINAIFNPVSGDIEGSPIYIIYSIESDLGVSADIEIEYSTDGVVFGNAATALGSDPLHEGVVALSADADGVQHTFVWDAIADLGGDFAGTTNILRIRAFDGTSFSGWFLSQVFEISIAAVTTIRNPKTGDNLGSPIDINYRIASRITGIVFSIEVEYSTDGGSVYDPCTALGSDPDHEGTSGLSDGDHTFVWDTETDIGPSFQGDVFLRVRTHNTHEWGAFAVSGKLFVDFFPSTSTNSPAEGSFNGSPVLVIYGLLTNREGETASVDVEFNADGGGWVAATADAGHPSHTVPSGLSSGLFTFAWDSAADLTLSFTSSDVKVRTTADDGTNTGAASESSTFVVDLLPEVTIQSPTASDSPGSPIDLNYTIFSRATGLTFSVDVDFSTDGGSMWDPATALVADPDHDGVSGLSEGALTFVWDSDTDLGSSFQDTAHLRIRANNGTAPGAYAQTDELTIDMFPSTETQTPEDGSINGSPIDITYLLSSFREGEVMDVDVEFNADGGGWTSCTALGSDPDHTPPTGLSPGVFTFVWDSKTDLTLAYNSADVLVRTTADDGTNTGAANATDAFTVNLLPSVAITSPVVDDTLGSPIDIVYTISSLVAGLTFSVEVEYSTDGGSIYDACTALGSDPNHDGVSGLSAGSRTFVWDTESDLGPSFQDAVLVQVRASNGTAFGPFAVSDLLTVDMFPAVIVSAPLSGSRNGSPVFVHYRLISRREGEVMSVDVEFNADGGGWTAATADAGAPGHSTPTGLSPGNFIFAWDSETDLTLAFDSTDVFVRMTPDDGTNAGTTVSSDQFSVEFLPDVTISSPTGDDTTLGSPVEIDYQIDSLKSGLTFSVEVDYSTDGGSIWNTAAEDALNPNHDGISGLSSGSSLTFVWDTESDLGSSFSATVLVRIRANNGTADGAYTQSDILSIDMLPTTSTTAPLGSSINGSPIEIDYELKSNRAGVTSDVTVEFNADGGGWMAATEDVLNPAHDPPTGLSPGTFTFVWDSTVDLGLDFSSADVKVRTSADDGTNVSTPSESGTFSVVLTPTVDITSPDAATAQGSPVLIGYTIGSLVSGLTFSIEVEYSTDGGSVWDPATADALNPNHDGTSGLSDDTPYVFAWDTEADLGSSFQDDVLVRIRGDNGTGTGDYAQASLTIDMFPSTSTVAPLQGSQESTPVNIEYQLLSLRDGAVMDVTVEFNVSDTGWFACTPLLSDGNHTVPTGLSSGDFIFVWDSGDDLSTVSSFSETKVRTFADDGTNVGAASDSSEFEVSLLPKAPTLVDPIDGFFDGDTTPDFIWEVPEDPGDDRVSFGFEIDDDIKFNSLGIDHDSKDDEHRFRHKVVASAGTKEFANRLRYYVRNFAVTSYTPTTITFASLLNYHTEVALASSLTNPQILLVNKADRRSYIPPSSITATGFDIAKSTFGIDSDGLVDLLIWSDAAGSFDSFWVDLSGISDNTSYTYGVAPFDTDILGNSIPASITNCRPVVLEGNDCFVYLEGISNTGFTLRVAEAGINFTATVRVGLRATPSDEYVHSNFPIPDLLDEAHNFNQALDDLTNGGAAFPTYLPGTILSVQNLADRSTVVDRPQNDAVEIRKSAAGLVGDGAVDFHASGEPDANIPYWTDISAAGIPDAYEGKQARYRVTAADALAIDLWNWRVRGANQS